MRGEYILRCVWLIFQVMNIHHLSRSLSNKVKRASLQPTVNMENAFSARGKGFRRQVPRQQGFDGFFLCHKITKPGREIDDRADLGSTCALHPQNAFIGKAEDCATNSAIGRSLFTTVYISSVVRYRRYCN